MSSGTSIYIFFIFLLLVFFFILTFVVRYRKRIKEKQQMQSEFSQALLQTQLEIQEQTLKNISQEIHDNIGQVLGVAKINLNTFANIKEEADVIKLNDTKALLSKAIRDLRDLSRSMHGDRIAELGLMAAIENELKILENSGQYKTSLKITGDVYRQNSQKEMVIFRIMQEALHNCVKHAKARNIDVLMNYDDSQFSFDITDNGNGFDMNALSASDKGIGLRSMQNRAALIGAVVTVDSIVGSGTSIKLSMTNTEQKFMDDRP